MASFTDKPMQFNPYIQQLPVEEMVKVGMIKQDQYDKGVQKIQGQIDQVAGLDIYKDVDKAYLQSKLNQLGGNLTTVAAGDFSNFQLVNSVGGMVKQIGNDKIVRTAVGSTAWLRKQQAQMEKAISEGKSSQQNQWDFGEKANRYLNSNEVGETFSDRYTQFTDVNKKWMEVLKQLHPNLTEQDIPYERNADGSLNYNKIAAAMSRVTKETISADQIENAIHSNLSPDDLNQLNIDGRYQFRGAGVPQLQEYATKKYNANVKTVDDKIKTLEGYLNLTQSNPEEQDKVNKSIESLKQSKIKLENGLKNELDFMSKNPEEAKSEIYKNGAIFEFANAFSWETNKTNLLTNPVLEAQHWEKKYALDQSQFNLSVRSQNWTEYKGTFDMNMANKNYELAVNKQITDLYGASSGFHTYGGESTDIKSPVTAMKTDAVDRENAANNEFDNLLKQIPGTTSAMLENSLKEYANGKKDAIPVNFRENADVILSNRTEALRINTAINRVDNELKNSKEWKDKEAVVYNLVKDLPELNVTFNGVKYKFTQREIADYVSKKVANSYASPGGVGMSVINFSSDLTQREKILSKLDPLTKGLNDMKFSDLNPFKKQPESDEIFTNTMIKYENALGNNMKNYLKSFEETKNKKLLEITGKYVPVITNINVSNKDGAMSRDTWEGIAGAVLLRYSMPGGTKGGAEGINIKTAREWLNSKDKDNIQYKKLIQGDKTYLVLMNGNSEALIPLTNIEASQLPKFKSESSDFQQRVTSAQYMNNGNTNISNDPTLAILPTSNFGNVKNLSVTADLQWNDKNRSINYITLNLKTPSGWKPLMLEVPVDADGALEFANKANDKYIKNLYLTNSKVPSSWKEEIKNL